MATFAAYFYFFLLQVEPKELRVHMEGSGSNMAAVGPIHITNLGPDTAFKLSIFVLQVSFCTNMKEWVCGAPYNYSEKLSYSYFLN
jgi:hypothetical protein